LRDSILSRGGLRAIIDADGSCTLSVALLIWTSFLTNDLHGLQGQDNLQCPLVAMTDPAKIEQFIAVTGVNEDAARFYLDSSSGDLETAVNQFFATGGVQEAPEASAEDLMDEAAPPAASQPGEIRGPLMDSMACTQRLKGQDALTQSSTDTASETYA